MLRIRPYFQATARSSANPTCSKYNNTDVCFSHSYHCIIELPEYPSCLSFRKFKYGEVYHYDTTDQHLTEWHADSSNPPDPTVDSILPVVQQSPSAVTQPVLDRSQTLQADMNHTSNATNGHQPPPIPDKQVVEGMAIFSFLFRAPHDGKLP